jgi:NAD(P)-dependent dehydrogenase (short-subunit alcohol dehydrogenase family)
MSSGFSRQVAVVTGGSKGIGRAIALDLVRIGYDIAILDPLPEGAVTADLARTKGGRALHLLTDVSCEEAVETSVQRIQSELGTPSVLINNAGIHPRDSILELTYEAWQKTMNVNLGGTFLCSRAFASGMFKLGKGAIVNIASVKGLKPSLNAAPYAASKAGIIALTRCSALEFAPVIRVNAVLPGIADTDQPREGLADEAELYAKGRQIPMGRIAQPEDIAAAVRFFISEDADYLTGQSLCVNGGGLMY